MKVLLAAVWKGDSGGMSMLPGASTLGIEEPWSVREGGRRKGSLRSRVLMQGLLGPSHRHSSRLLGPRNGLLWPAGWQGAAERGLRHSAWSPRVPKVRLQGSGCGAVAG